MTKLIMLGAVCALALTACNKATDNATAPAAVTPAAAPGPVAPPANGDWTTTVSETPEGGYLKGNPNAAVKLIEYGALSCPHCAHFSHDSHDELEAMIKTGKISYELRPFLVHPQLDLAATLLARCSGPATFFPLADQFFARQDDWMGEAKFKTLTPAVQQAWASMTPNQLAADVATRLDLVTFVGQRGISADKAKACLADKAGVDKLNALVTNAESQYHVNGTPTFILNGSVLADVNDWAGLKPKLKAVLGG